MIGRLSLFLFIKFAMKLFLLITCFFIASNSIAQTPKEIEADLLKSFKKIGYWRRKLNDTSFNSNDSLDKVNCAFGEQLKFYTSKYPSTITQNFVSLKKAQLNIHTSKDSLFRIYSWDTGLEGTTRNYDFDNVYQYKINNKTNSIFKRDTIYSSDSGYVYSFSNLYTLKVNGKTYFMGVYNGYFGSWSAGQGIQVFAIENSKLNDDVKLIKTKTGLHNQLYYDYSDFWGSKSSIHYDDYSKTICLPVVYENGEMTRKFIRYKFTGQYFERVKN